MESQTLAPRRLTLDETQLPPTDVAHLTTLLVNVAFVGTPYARGPLPEWVLIDAGMQMQAHRIAAFARERFGDAPPRAILLTHGHFDHVGSLHALLRMWPDVPVYAHRFELPYLTGGSSKWPLDLLRDAGVDMETPEPVNAALKYFDRLVTELDELL